jgi:hypothetical protein
VTLNDGSTAGLLENGVNAILIDRDELEKRLPIAVDALLGSREERARLSQAGHETFERTVGTWDDRMRREESALNELLSRNSHG